MRVAACFATLFGIMVFATSGASSLHQGYARFTALPSVQLCLGTAETKIDMTQADALGILASHRFAVGTVGTAGAPQLQAHADARVQLVTTWTEACVRFSTRRSTGFPGGIVGA